MSQTEFDQLNEQMLVKLFEISPDAATQSGKHKPYDLHLPHGGFKRLDDTLKLLESWHKEASRIAASAELTPDQGISLELLEMSLELQRFAIDDYPMWKMYPNGLEHPGWLLFLMAVREYAPLPDRVEGIVSRIGELPRYLGEFRQRFSDSKPVRVWTEIAIETCEGVPDYLAHLRSFSQDSISSSLLAQMDKNIAYANEDIADHKDWLKGMLDVSVEQFAMGKEKFAKLLKIRGIDYLPDEILAIAEMTIHELKEERVIISSRISPDGTPEKAKQIVESDTPDTIEDVLAVTSSETENAKRFLIEHDLITLDHEGILNFVKTPEFLSSAIPTAALMMPAIFDKTQHGTYLITDPPDKADLRSLWNRAAIINTVVHEAYPGHFHQGVVSNSKPWMHQLPHMLIAPDTMIPAYEMMEGWAHYCEKMMYGHKFCGTDKDALAMIEFGLWRACRAIYDVELAQGNVSIDEMVEMFVRETSTTRNSAEADVKGFSHTPGYGLSYMMGRKMVLEFRKELEDEPGQRFDEKLFHDLMAENGNLPFHLARKVVRSAMAPR